MMTIKPRPNARTTAVLLAFLFGTFGAHRFYLGQVGWGLTYLVFFWTGIPSVASIVEGIIYLTMSDQDFALKYMTPPGYMVVPSVAAQEMPITNQILRVARQLQGRVTAVEVAAETDIPLDQIKAELERLAVKHNCQMTVGEAGLVVYYFPEFENAHSKLDALHETADWVPAEAQPAEPRREQDRLN